MFGRRRAAASAIHVLRRPVATSALVPRRDAMVQRAGQLLRQCSPGRNEPDLRKDAALRLRGSLHVCSSTSNGSKGLARGLHTHRLAGTAASGVLHRSRVCLHRASPLSQPVRSANSSSGALATLGEENVVTLDQRPPLVFPGTLIKLNKREKNLFRLLEDVRLRYKLDVNFRIAGGWVRNKLMGKEGDDVDVALDNMTGEAFSKYLSDYCVEKGIEELRFANIKVNPSQSKHLQTTRTTLFGMEIDLVNLRSETYAHNSRIPDMRFGTPGQDAHRRDMTINSLFYNLNTQMVEDYTHLGMSDLEQNLIRTPLPPKETFLDDPLRVLRVIRFASTYGFNIHPETTLACLDDDVQEALRRKVSRERVTVELQKMLTNSRNHVRLVELLHNGSLLNIIFPFNQNYGWSSAFRNLSVVQDMRSRQARPSRHVSEDGHLAFLASILFHACSVADAYTTTDYTPRDMVESLNGRSLAFHLVHNLISKSLKFSAADASAVFKIIHGARNAYFLLQEASKYAVAREKEERSSSRYSDEDLTPSNIAMKRPFLRLRGLFQDYLNALPLETALWLRAMGHERWQLSLMLSVLPEEQHMVDEDKNTEVSVMDFGAVTDTSLSQRDLERIQLHSASLPENKEMLLSSYVRIEAFRQAIFMQGKVLKSIEMTPLVRGNQISDLLGIPSGPRIGIILQEMIRFQIQNNPTEHDVKQWLREQWR